MATEPKVVVVRNGKGTLKVEVQARSHTLLSDEPVTNGGTDLGPEPYELLSAALGSCIAITARLYANRKDWPLENVTVRLQRSRLREKAESTSGFLDVDVIGHDIEVTGPLTDEQRTRIIEIAARCPVARTLQRGVRLLSA